jgi:hypothetical protein
MAVNAPERVVTSAQHSGGKGHERRSISLPRDLAAYVRERAGARGESESRVIAEAIRILRRVERKRLTTDALLHDAEIDRHLAEEALRSAPPLPE